MAPLFNAGTTVWHFWLGLRKKHLIFITFQAVVPSHNYHLLRVVLLNSRIMHPTPFLSLVGLAWDFLLVVDAVQPLLKFLQHLQRQSTNHLEGFLVLQYWKGSFTNSVLYPVRIQAKYFTAQVSSPSRFYSIVGLKYLGCFAFSIYHPVSSMV